MSKERVNNRSIELAKLSTDQAHTARGQYLGALVTMVGIGGALTVVLVGGPWQVAIALVGVPIVGAVRAIIQGRQ